MAFDPISAALDIGGKLIDRLWPDPAQAAQLQQQGELAQMTANTELAKAQVQVDQAEAANTDPLQHWRGGAGWVCVGGLGYEYLVAPIGNAVLHVVHQASAFPEIDTSTLMPLLMWYRLIAPVINRLTLSACLYYARYCIEYILFKSLIWRDLFMTDENNSPVAFTPEQAKFLQQFSNAGVEGKKLTMWLFRALAFIGAVSAGVAVVAGGVKCVWKVAH